MDRDFEGGPSSSAPSSAADTATSSVGDHGSVGESLENATSKNMRRWPRFAVDIPLQVQVTTQGPTKVLACAGQGTDISYGGLAVTADIDLPVGAQIGVEFTPPGSQQRLLFRCFVRNRNGNCYGVQFITENDEDYRKAGELQVGLAAMSARPR
ncbi:MAG TPA: PilZ domain-containing protein [Terriglobales bacterium]|nr:PilZ domain-containing protein [Terriglobales bacterium]